MKTAFLTGILSVTFLAGICFAGGAGSIVAKAGGKGYSASTRGNFLSSCMEGADKSTCECVLRKLEGKYNEATFIRLEEELTQGKDNPEVVDFIVESTTSCMLAEVERNTQPSTSGGTASGQGVSLSSDEMALLKAMMQSKLFKNSFADECADEADDWLGKTQARKACECAYNNLVNDESLLYLMAGATNAEGEAEDFENWGYEILVSCLPKQFTPEMEKAFVRECVDEAEGANKATCQCVWKEIKKDYTVQSMMKSVISSEDKFVMDIMVKAAKCLQ